MFVKNRITKIPKQLVKTTAFVVISGGLTMIIFDLFAFLLQMSKNLIASGRIYLGLFCIVLYYMKSVASSSVSLWLDDMKNQQNEQGEMLVNTRTAEVLTKVRDKVFLNDGNTMSSSQILSSMRNYLEELWRFKLSIPSGIISTISAIITFVGFVIVTNIEVKNVYLFISVICIISILSIFFSNKRLQCMNRFRKARKELNDEENEIKNDILNIEPQDEKHSNYMIGTYMEAMKKSFDYARKDWKSINRLWWFETLFNSFATIFIIGIKIFEVGIENVTLETVLSVIALQTIYSQIIEKIRMQIRTVESYREKLQKISTFEPDVKQIVAVYKQEEAIEFSSADLFSIPKFEVEYKTGEKHYKLVNSNEFQLHTGECLLLTGPTGCGKSTFMKMLTGKIRLDNVFLSNIMSVMHYSDTKLGCHDVLSEVVFGQDYNEEKLLYILKGVHLYEEISLKNSDVIEYLRNTKSENYSNGQKQRLLIARILYNLEECVKIVAFDEATNALNDAIAEQTITFIKEYCKSKLLVIATHQVDICRSVATRHFEFVNNGGTYELEERVDLDT